MLRTPSLAVFLAVILACASCTSGEGAKAGQARSAGDSDSVAAPPPVANAATIPPRWPAELTESSGAAVSRRQPGIWFTINDSGNPPQIFAIDTAGVDRGAWRLDRARNVDWESLALGPCGAPAAGACLYVGDTGDNDARLPTRAIYRVAEPDARRPGSRAELPAERLDYRYADGPRDVEAMFVAANRDVFLVTKRRIRDAGGRVRPALVYRIPASAWEPGDTAVAAAVDSLPIVPASAPGRVVTDAALSPSGRRLAVRTYTEVYVFAADPLTGRVDHRVPPEVCSLAALDEPVGEGIAWVDEGRLLFTSEGATEPAHVATCAGRIR